MTRRRSTMKIATLVSAAGLLVACGSAATPPESVLSQDGAVLPDTATLNGVMVMHHAADAFERAPKWSLDPKPVVVFSGGDNTDFDLESVLAPVLLADQRLIARSRSGMARLVLFKSNGTPDRVLARAGQGPGDLAGPTEPLWIGGDSVIVLDGSTHRLSRFTADDGYAGSTRIGDNLNIFCFTPIGMTSDRHAAFLDGCTGPGDIQAKAVRSGRVVALAPLSFERFDSLAAIAGAEFIEIETRYGGRKNVTHVLLRLGLRGTAAAWGDQIATSDSGSHYGIDIWNLDGKVSARIRVDISRRAVTAAMRDAVIAKELAAISGPGEGRMVDANESRRQARENPFADSLPPFERLRGGSDGLLWAVDPHTFVDSNWTATAFNTDGAIVGRLTSIVPGLPVWFGRDQVLVREEDADGVVRFVLYKMKHENP